MRLIFVGERFKTKVAIMLNDILDEVRLIDLKNISGLRVLEKRHLFFLRWTPLILPPLDFQLCHQLQGIFGEKYYIMKIVDAGLGKVYLERNGFPGEFLNFCLNSILFKLFPQSFECRLRDELTKLVKIFDRFFLAELYYPDLFETTG